MDAEAEIQRLCLELNDAGYTAEISWGRVVVSPWTSISSADVVESLVDMLFPVKRANGWRIHQNVAVHIPPLLDHRIPDLTVTPRHPERHDDMRLHGYGTLLVVEVCSPGTRTVDWYEKPMDYARAGVPLYLVVDPVTAPPTVTLMSGPVGDLAMDDERQPYQEVVTVEAGQPLELPEPFGVKLDTSLIFD
ncbi:Uma2 family endonuclease [Microtetraspora niveoalba]|uniref:Uma2 family endonuclease n=1 Tax=Microtetraspora niveoalba TaxID=46175 RepID=UPI000830FB82|nr:Uma2 family endonuclease [Microtetraspora niveoalba]